MKKKTYQSMNRRHFLKTSLYSSAALATAGYVVPSQPPVQQGKLLSAYYFRAHMYTMVPRQVREDLKWMADLGTNAVCPAIIEQDLFAAVENMDIVCNEAAKLNMQVLAVPSRWAGLIAGAPKIPSLFTIQHPETYALKENGEPQSSSVSGRISSFHHHATVQFFKETAERMYELWPISGLIWDEPKAYSNLDYSQAAKDALEGNITRKAHIQAFSDFWSNINQYLKEKYPNKSTHFFAFAHYGDEPDILESAAQIQDLDYFGCDGRPWGDEDGGKNENSGKVLLSDKGGEAFLEAAKKYNKKSLWLIENHNMAMKDADLMDRRLPEILEKDIDHLIYYYYPRNLEDPEKIMGIIAKHLKGWM